MPTNETNNMIKTSINGETKLIEAPNWDDIQTSRLKDVEFSKHEQQEKSDTEDNSDSFKISTSKDLLNSEIEEEQFIVTPLIPEQAITSITADSGKGKSLLALVVAVAISKGEKLFGEYEVKKNNVLIIDQEMNKFSIISRFKKIADENTDGVDYIIDQNFKITDEEDFYKLVFCILRNGYGVVVFDTFVEIFSNGGGENDSGAMKEVNAKLLELIRLTKVSLVYLHHHKKRAMGEQFSQSSSRGSTEIIAKVSSHLLLDSKNSMTEDGENALDITISQEKARSAQRLAKKITIRIINTENKIKWEFLGEVEEKTEVINKAKESILEMLKEVPGLTVQDVKTKTKIGTNNIRLALTELVDSGILDVGKLGKANYYSPTINV